MEAAAENLEFEKAAALRDRLRAITLLGKRQKVVAGFLADTDVLGLYVGTVRSVVAVLHFQGGETGRAGTWRSFPHRLGGAGGGDSLGVPWSKYYSPRGILPRQILLPENLEGAADTVPPALPPSGAEGGPGDPPNGGPKARPSSAWPRRTPTTE